MGEGVSPWRGGTKHPPLELGSARWLLSGIGGHHSSGSELQSKRQEGRVLLSFHTLPLAFLLLHPLSSQRHPLLPSRRPCAAGTTGTEHLLQPILTCPPAPPQAHLGSSVHRKGEVVAGFLAS